MYIKQVVSDHVYTPSPGSVALGHHLHLPVDGDVQRGVPPPAAGQVGEVEPPGTQEQRCGLWGLTVGSEKREGEEGESPCLSSPSSSNSSLPPLLPPFFKTPPFLLLSPYPSTPSSLLSVHGGSPPSQNSLQAPPVAFAPSKTPSFCEQPQQLPHDKSGYTSLAIMSCTVCISMFAHPIPDTAQCWTGVSACYCTGDQLSLVPRP